MVLYPVGARLVLKESKPSHRLDRARRIMERVKRWVDQPLQEHSRRNLSRGQRSNGQ